MSTDHWKTSDWVAAETTHTVPLVLSAVDTFRTYTKPRYRKNGGTTHARAMLQWVMHQSVQKTNSDVWDATIYECWINNADAITAIRFLLYFGVIWWVRNTILPGLLLLVSATIISAFVDTSDVSTHSNFMKRIAWRNPWCANKRRKGKTNQTTKLFSTGITC